MADPSDSGEGKENESVVSLPPVARIPASDDVTSTKDEESMPGESTALLNMKVTSANANGDAASSSHQCYCLKERNFNLVELQCASCFRWFHESCITYHIGKCLPFMTNYTFVCKTCNPTGLESFSKRQANFTQICQTTLANLSQQSVKFGNPRNYFSKDKDIIPYIDTHWENLTSMPRRIKQTWHTTVVKTMFKEPEIFHTEGYDEVGSDQPLFGLVVKDLTKIGPNYDSVLKLHQMKATDTQKLCTTTSSPSTLTNLTLTGKGRSAKRKLPEQSYTSTKKTRSSDLTVPKLPAHGYPLEHPFNKDGYRYILAEPDPHAPHRQEFDESSDWAGKPIPGWLYRTLMPPMVLLALNDRAPQMRISDDRLSATGEKGYCMVRATHGVNRGCWYFETVIDDMPEGSATRLGWSQALGNLQAPLGYDRFSYSWRSRKGTIFHESHGKHYSSGYGEGDILGFLIVLPEDERALVTLPPTYKDKPLVKFKSHLYYEEKDDVQKAIKSLEPLPRSKIFLFKNGIPQGLAFQDLNCGAYYPAFSIYKNATISVNFGPRFRYPPKKIRFRGMHEAAHEVLIEQAFSDALYLVENDGKLRLDTYTV